MLLLFPFDSTKRALVVLLSPFVDAVQVELMITLASNQRAVIAWELTLRTRAFHDVVADAALVLLDVPVPTCYCDPLVYLHFHLT